MLLRSKAISLINKLCLILCICLPQPVYAQLPNTVEQALHKIGLPVDQVSVYVQALPAQASANIEATLQHQSTVALNPASTMKLLTSYAGLALLGPNYRWKTEVYGDGNLHDGVLDGNLYIKAFGDPSFMSADFWRLLNRLRQLGVREIKGDLIIDNNYFALETQSRGSFDADTARAYNATPSALAINQKASSFRFDSDDHQVTIQQEPDLAQIEVVNLLKVGAADCARWRNTLNYDVKQDAANAIVTFSGVYAAQCGEKYLDLLALDENNYTLHFFTKLWQQLGGRFDGKLQVLTKPNAMPLAAVKLLQQDSKTLAQILPDINKWSNNLMARQLLLTIAAEKMGAPATEANGALAVDQWLKSVGLNFNELVIDNGSGLSRIERISAQHMGEMLVSAYYSPVMSELMSSLPILAVDGTLQRRMIASDASGRAHLKTGSINGVMTLAGYMLSQRGQRYVVVFMVNHAKMALTKPAQDALLEWVYAQ
jgi:D-alanyl-D-alanine carboxypeptidase/D-alanyl-D-alanine-endopeptidase (penicillin-binding protein 4)